jgi:hypothetical protein
MDNRIHALGVFVYGALAIAGCMWLAAMAGSDAGMALAILSAAIAWLSQGLWAAEIRFAGHVAWGSAAAGIASVLASLAGF